MNWIRRPAPLLSTSEERLNAAGEVWNAACYSLDRAQRGGVDSFYDCATSIVLLAFSFEAWINHVCEVSYRRWDKSELWSEKLQHLYADILHECPDWGRAPLQTIAEAFQFRDRLAQPKTCIASEVDEEWGRYCTLERALRTYQHVREEAARLWHPIGGTGAPLNTVTMTIECRYFQGEWLDVSAPDQEDAGERTDGADREGDREQQARKSPSTRSARSRAANRARPQRDKRK